MPEQIPIGTRMAVENKVLLESWVGAIVYVKFENSDPVEAKIVEVGDSHTDVIILKQATLRDVGMQEK